MPPFALALFPCSVGRVLDPVAMSLSGQVPRHLTSVALSTLRRELAQLLVQAGAGCRFPQGQAELLGQAAMWLLSQDQATCLEMSTWHLAPRLHPGPQTLQVHLVSVRGMPRMGGRALLCSPQATVASRALRPQLLAAHHLVAMVGM
jgi:hypothetical protein